MRILRPTYLNKLISGQGNGLIKIITGLRRCGKSYLLFNLYSEYLLDNGVSEDHMIRIDLEDIRNDKLKEPHALVEYIDARMKDNSMYYILIDEVQNIKGFESVLNSYLKIENADVYVTGSNSKFLSKDIATEFRGRGDEIHMYPLSFSEYYSAAGGDLNIAWRDYMTYGGLPHVLRLDSHERKAKYLEQIYSTVYLRDLMERENIAKVKEFDELVRIIASGIGSPCNPTKLSNTFKSSGHTELSSQTIKNYLEILEDAFLIEKSERYDVKGKKYINTLSKYYMTDMGIRNGLLDFRQMEETHIMENIIYNELKIRGFSVDVGSVEIKGKNERDEWFRKQLEIDFVANQNHKRYYIQSAFAMPDKEKLQQESNSLKNINDGFKKIIVVKDFIHPWYTEDGILVIGLFDFLLNSKSIDY
ncbi:MAG: ATP-binding protein [Muribaculaceae bacterium]|nr:ATP-binding protein [Muribaculaceae bacterium]